jgi:hypothetical protein
VVKKKEQKHGSGYIDPRWRKSQRTCDCDNVAKISDIKMRWRKPRSFAERHAKNLRKWVSKKINEPDETKKGGASGRNILTLLNFLLVRLVLKSTFTSKMPSVGVNIRDKPHPFISAHRSGAKDTLVFK